MPAASGAVWVLEAAAAGGALACGRVGRMNDQGVAAAGAPDEGPRAAAGRFLYSPRNGTFGGYGKAYNAKFDAESGCAETGAVRQPIERSTKQQIMLPITGLPDRLRGGERNMAGERACPNRRPTRERRRDSGSRGEGSSSTARRERAISNRGCRRSGSGSCGGRMFCTARPTRRGWCWHWPGIAIEAGIIRALANKAVFVRAVEANGRWY